MASLVGKKNVSESSEEVVFVTAAHCGEKFDKGDVIRSFRLGGNITITARAIHEKYIESIKGRKGTKQLPDAAYDIAFFRGILNRKTDKEPLPIWTYQECQESQRNYYLIACPTYFSRAVRDAWGPKRIFIGSAATRLGCSGGAWFAYGYGAIDPDELSKKRPIRLKAICGVVSMGKEVRFAVSGAVAGYFVDWAKELIGDF